MSHDLPTTTYKINRERVDTEFIRNKLKFKSLGVKNSFNEKYPHVKKFFDDHGIDLGKIRAHSAKVIATGALTGTLLFAPPMGVKNLPQLTEVVKNMTDGQALGSNIPYQELLLNNLHAILPQKIGPLDRSTEKSLEQVFQQIIGINARAGLEGEHLNTTYGYIGAEQHLMRYPGDTMATHPKIPEHDEGMAPGRGAWGYVPAKNETWYAVVQTLYLPDWNTRQPYLQNWYKYRKVLIVNTINGNAVVADIADAGPAAFTGKHFGGSPEVMNYLGGPRYKKGPVIVFFVDDPNNKVPLGPVEYNIVNIPGVELTQA
ncbi:MAG: hypothetical protein HYV90_02075 [Candidatus Woesebacteria bacterium]|nr:MAG: hypothetical protein HYV90_02075 [Candidatus Woesebacteria bacterium]